MKKNKTTLDHNVLCEPLNTCFIDSKPVPPLAANDSKETSRSYSKSRTAHNKMLMRRRKRSQHPLRDLRLKRGFTLEELAELTTLSPSYLSRLESGSRRLNADILQRIATILGCHPGDLLSTDTHFYKLSSVDDTTHSQNYYMKDLPLHELTADESSLQSYHITNNSEKWITRPPQLCGIHDSFAFRVSQPCCGNRYDVNDYIFADPTLPIVPGCHVLIRTHQNKIFIGQFVQWKASEKSEFADILVVSLKTPHQQNEPVIFKKSEVKTSCRIVGTAEAA